MNSISMMSKLFYLITTADGEINSKEFEMGRRLILNEDVKEEKFEEELKVLKTFKYDEIYEDYLDQLRREKNSMQVYYLAWMALIANADGFMEKNEWQLIYKLYHKELKLDLKEIMNAQRDLVHKINKAF